MNELNFLQRKSLMMFRLLVLSFFNSGKKYEESQSPVAR